MLEKQTAKFHKVERGQTLADIAAYFCTSVHLLVEENGLKRPIFVGQILRIPDQRGNLYRVREGDTKTLLCGSVERYEKLNGKTFYIGMLVLL